MGQFPYRRSRRLKTLSAGSPRTSPQHFKKAISPRLQNKQIQLDSKEVLGVDIENGTRWGWGPNGYTYPQIYAVAWKWVGSPDEDVKCILLDWRQSNETLKDHCGELWDDLSRADKFLGHNFRHDWGGLQGLARDLELPFLKTRPLVDTFKDIPNHTGPSRSLEDLCQQFGLGPKPHLSQRDWTEAFIRWFPDKLEMVKNRNTQDVILTERLYLKEKELGWIDD